MKSWDYNPEWGAREQKFLDDLKSFQGRMRVEFVRLMEKSGLAMVNRKHPNEFDNEEIAGCAISAGCYFDTSFGREPPPLSVLISMDESGYTIAKPQPTGSINASFVWVTFAQLDEVEEALPEHGYVKVDGKWQRG